MHKGFTHFLGFMEDSQGILPILLDLWGMHKSLYPFYRDLRSLHSEFYQFYWGLQGCIYGGFMGMHRGLYQFQWGLEGCMGAFTTFTGV